MPPVTTRRTPKSWAWSYSKLKNFEVCPKRHYHVDIARDFKEEEGGNLLWGNRVHEALAKRIKDGTPLPDSMSQYEDWAQRVLTGSGTIGTFILVEEKYALNEKLQGSEYFGRDTWFRGVADVLKIVETTHGGIALAVDWKTGKVLEDSVQLALMAQCVFAFWPGIVKIRTEFIWLKEDATTREDFVREDMPMLWQGLMPRIHAMKVAHDTATYPARPCHLCRKFCPVTTCIHHGK